MYLRANTECSVLEADEASRKPLHMDLNISPTTQ